MASPAVDPKIADVTQVAIFAGFVYVAVSPPSAFVLFEQMDQKVGDVAFHPTSRLVTSTGHLPDLATDRRSLDWRGGLPSDDLTHVRNLAERCGDREAQPNTKHRDKHKLQGGRPWLGEDRQL